MTDSATPAEASGFDELVSALEGVTDLEITDPEKVEVRKITDGQFLVRVIRGDGELESRIVSTR